MENTISSATEDSTSTKDESPRQTQATNQTGEGGDWQFRVGHSEGQGVFQDRSLTPIELFPYVLADDSLFFADLRFYPTNQLTYGGNAGLGYRYYSNGWDRIFGASVWYDADDTRSKYLQQLGLSLETYAGPLDFRTNLYLPVGDTSPQTYVGVVDGSSRFQEENILYDRIRSFYSAMKGVDLEAGIPLPGDFAEEHGIRIYGGWYHYVDDRDESITGASARLQANIAAGLDAELLLTNDSFFDTRGFVGVSWTFGPLHRSELSQENARGRIGEHVRRNYTVLAPKRKQIDRDRLAINPQTGNPYLVAHVFSGAAPVGMGTVNNPFQTIAQAQAAGKDLVFVHASSVFSGADATIVLNSGERILGDGNGIQHYVSVPVIGHVLLPHGPTVGNRPVLDSSIGDGITLASHTEFSGFTIASPTGNGIVGSGVSDVMIHDVAIDAPGVDGIHLVNSSGAINIFDANVMNAVGNGLLIDGGTAEIRYNGQIAASMGRELVVSNTTSGAVDLTGAQIDGTLGQGILLQDDDGRVILDNVSLANSSAVGIEIEGGLGAIRFLDTTTVSNSAGPSVSITNRPAAGSVLFDNLSINSRQDRGLQIDNVAGSVAVSGATTISNVSGATDSAVDIRNSSGNFAFGTVSITDSTGDPGVNLQNNTGATSFNKLDIAAQNGTAFAANNAGTLVVNGTANSALGGTIQAVNGTAIDILDTTLLMNLTSVSSSGAVQGLRLENTPGLFAVYGTGTAGSGGTIQGATSGVYLKNTGLVGLASMVLNSNGVGISAEKVTNLELRSSQITNSTSYGIDALDTPTLVVRGSSFNGNGAANIRGQFDQLGSYAYTIGSSQLISTTADNVLLKTLAGGQGASLNLIVNGSIIQNTFAGTSGIDVNWDGTLAAAIAYTSITVGGGADTGILIDNASTSGLTNIAITNNLITGLGNSDTGLHLSTAGASLLTINNNQVQFGATNGTGLRLSLAALADVTLSNNLIGDTTDGATAILFDAIDGPGSVAISNNLITVANGGGLLDRGIIFSSVTNTISLSGAHNNVVSGTDTPFFVPIGTTTGSIIVNDTHVP